MGRLFELKYFLNVVLLPLLFFLFALWIIYTSPQGPEFLRYDRALIEQGEWWRIITSHFTHTTWNHFYLNMAGLGIMAIMFSEVATFWRWLSLAIFCSGFCSACFMFFQPYEYNYVGMSDILHGVIVAYAMLDFRNFVFGNTFLIGGTAAKVIWEQSPYYVESSGEFIGGRVATESHMYGAISGLLIGLVLLGLDYWLTQSNTKDAEKS